jgi:TolA-binding protein
LNGRCAIKRRLILGLLSLVLIFVFTSATACVPKRTTTDTTPTTSTSADSERITALEDKVNQLQAKLASLPSSDNSTDYSGEITALQSDIENIYAQFEETQNQIDDAVSQVDDTLAAWEEEQAQEQVAIVNSTTRWDIEVSCSNPDATVEVEVNPSRIDEADTYDIDIQVTNSTGTDMTGIYLLAYYLPRDATTLVDSNDTDMYPASSPMINWSVDVITKSSGQTRRIECESAKFNLAAGASLVIRTEFDLAYQ